MAAGYCYCLGIKSNDFFLKDNKKAFILWLNVPKVTAYNHFADVSRVQCLLRKMMSEEYHGLIDQIKECQDPHAIFNIHGGNNLIAPTASQAEQKLVEKPADEIKKR